MYLGYIYLKEGGYEVVGWGLKTDKMGNAISRDLRFVLKHFLVCSSPAYGRTLLMFVLPHSPANF